MHGQNRKATALCKITVAPPIIAARRSFRTMEALSENRIVTSPQSQYVYLKNMYVFRVYLSQAATAYIINIITKKTVNALH